MGKFWGTRFLFRFYYKGINYDILAILVKLDLWGTLAGGKKRVLVISVRGDPYKRDFWLSSNPKMNYFIESGSQY